MVFRRRRNLGKRARRRSSRRRAAPRRSRRARARGVFRKLKGGSAFTQMSNIAGGLVFFSQLTGKDREAGRYPATLTTGEKAQRFVNNVLGRIIGFQPFVSMQHTAFTQTLNLDGALNKFTGIGLAALIYGSLPLKMLPHKGKAKTLGKRIATAGFLGGIFDAPGGSTTQTTQVVQSAPLIQSSGTQVTTA